jgi:hypothetical protein
MRFIRTIFLAILLSLAGLAAQYLHYLGRLAGPPALGRFAYAGASLLGLLWLFFSAIRTRRRGVAHFDMIVAAESLIAFGILSLLLGLGLSILILATRFDAGGLGDLGVNELEPLLLPVVEGLAATAVATILANVLRQLDVLRYGEAPVAPEEIPATPEMLERRLESLAARLDLTSEHLDQLALTFRQGAEDYAASIERLHAATSGLGGQVEAIGQQMRSFSSELAAAGTAGSEAVRELAAESRRFKDAAREGTTLLDGLARLIASVERFVRPGGRP